MCVIRKMLIDMVGIQKDFPDILPGKSFADVFEGKNDETGAVVVFDEYGPTRMIRTMEWKYIHHGPYGPDELYHFTEDPHETVNLIDRSEYSELADELYCRMVRWFHQYADPAMDASREGVTGLGQTCYK